MNKDVLNNVKIYTSSERRVIVSHHSSIAGDICLRVLEHRSDFRACAAWCRVRLVLEFNCLVDHQLSQPRAVPYDQSPHPAEGPA
jgi:hypothetical protein